MKPRRFLPLCAFLAVQAAAAQVRLAVELPRAGTSTETSSASFFWSPAARFQFVLSGADLAVLKGAKLTALEFRNWTSQAFQTRKGDASVVLRAAKAAHSPARSSRSFAANFGDKPVTLSSGRVHFNDALPYGGGGPTPWGDSRNFKIAFQRPFPYSGGDLVLDLEVRALPGKPLPFWIGRALARKIPFKETLYGNPTPGAAPDFRPRVYGSLLPGERTTLTLEGVPAGAPAFLLLGLSNTRFLGFPLPMPVAFSAGKAVLLRTSPDLAFPAVSVKPSLPPGLSPNNPSLSPFWTLQGEASVVLDFPWDPSFVGGVLYAQWFSLGVMGPGFQVQSRLASSPGLRLPILPAAAHLNAAFLSAESQDPKAALSRAESSSLHLFPDLRLEALR